MTNRLPDAIKQQRRLRYLELRKNDPDLLPIPDLEERLIYYYDDPERQDWMRRQLALWRGRR